LQGKLVQLTKAQNKRFLNVFREDKEVEAISSEINVLVRQCEQKVLQVKTCGMEAGSTPKDREFRQNVQRNLAQQLQQISQQYKQSQKDYLSEMRKRQRGETWDDGPGKTSASVDTGFSATMRLELDTMEETAGQRSEEICQIASSINDLHTIFKELAVLVIDQGTVLDRIDYNIEQVVHQSEEANVQLRKAEQSAQSNRALKCMLALVVANVILIVILILKMRY